MTKKTTLFTLMILVLLLSSCKGAEMQPAASTQAASPAVTAAPTATPIPPTQTPIPPTLTPTFTATPTPGIGSVRVFPKDSMPQVFVPAGEFLMGTLPEDVDPSYGMVEEPQHSVYLDGYWIDQTEVTNRMFASFVEETDYITDAEKGNWGITLQNGQPGRFPGVDWQHPHGASTNLDSREDQPVVQVSWNDAHAYCTWAGRRLPTEAEWEKAARGTNAQTYPWGEQEPDQTILAIDDLSAGPSDVGSHPKDVSPYGVLDMAGNVREWVADWYSDTYYKESPLSNPQGPETGEDRAFRGQCFGSSVRFMRIAVRSAGYQDERWGWQGFRCASSPP